jgi:hypothetical protein
MNVSYKKWMLSSLIITLTSYLSCGPNEPIVQPGPVEITATGKYTVRRTDGTLVFEREIDDLCEARGSVSKASNRAIDNPSYTELQMIIVCYDDEANEKYYKETLYDWRNPPIERFEGSFYFLKIHAPDDIYEKNSDSVWRTSERIVYDNASLAAQCYGINSGADRSSFYVDYEIKKISKTCLDGCDFILEISPRDLGACHRVSGSFLLNVKGLVYN